MFLTAINSFLSKLMFLPPAFSHFAQCHMFSVIASQDYCGCIIIRLDVRDLSLTFSFFRSHLKTEMSSRAYGHNSPQHIHDSLCYKNG